MNDRVLNMERGWPCKEQLSLSMPLLDMVKSDSELCFECDYRGYDGTGGILPIRQLFSEIFNVPSNDIYIGSTMSTGIMYDIVCKAMFWGINGEKPWKDQGQIKFLCPVPGYEKHFQICERFGIQMINIPLLDTGPDMNIVEEYLSKDPLIKGIWCVPLYSNPTGTIYSQDVIKKIANVKASNDFIVFWDNAYVVHHLTEEQIEIKNIFDYSKDSNYPNRVFEFFSTSKITFPGAGIAGCISSAENINWLKKNTLLQLKTGDKINQLRHTLFLKDKANVLMHMNKHRNIIKPKFDLVDKILSDIVGNGNRAMWNTPKGGYFINLELQDLSASMIWEKCKNSNVKITPAGSIFPYGKDPKDKFLRLAPTFPSMEDLEIAITILGNHIKNS